MCTLIWVIKVSAIWATLRAIRRFKSELAHKILTLSYQRDKRSGCHEFALLIQHHSNVKIGHIHSHSFLLKEGQLSVTGKTSLQALLYPLDGIS